MRIIISGALGHMGRELAVRAAQSGIEVAAGIDAAQGECAFPLYASAAELEKAGVKADVLIDFSVPAALDGLLAYALHTGTPEVLCTTGYDADELAKIDEAARRLPLFRSGNMSLGIALLRSLCKKAAQVLGEAYDVEIVEAHHNRKVDAPSGTALMLRDALLEGYDHPMNTVCGRSGRNCKRQKDDIGMHSIRGGTVTGEHQVYFLGNSERITISHSAENRGLFASGALRAAAYMAEQKKPGLYSMDDIVAAV